MTRRKTVLAVTSALTLGAGILMTGAVQAMPAGLNGGAGATGPVVKARYYGGRNCFHFGTWGAPGLRICNNSYRRGWRERHGWYRGPVSRGPVYGRPGWQRQWHNGGRQRQPIPEY